MKNISMKVAVGYAIPSTPDARWNEHEIPAGYAKVGVDKVVPMFSDMLLDIPGPHDETTLGDVVGATILWDKKYIKLPGSAPRTTPPPSRRSLHLHRLQEAHSMSTTTTARVHLDLRCRTWFSPLRRRQTWFSPLRRRHRISHLRRYQIWFSHLRRRLCPLRTISGSVLNNKAAQSESCHPSLRYLIRIFPS